MNRDDYTYLGRLDHLRFFAASLVIMFHFRAGLGQNLGDLSFSNVHLHWITNGHSGVALFLVMSGFLFAFITDGCKKHVNYFQFMKNRILRIFPLLVVLFFLVITVGRAESTPMDVLRLLTMQLNTGSERPGWGEEYLPVGLVWTIAVEMQFYLIFPFLAFFVKRNGIKHLGMLLVFFVLARYAIVEMKGVEQYTNFYSTLVGRIDQFLIGMIIGCVYVQAKKKRINSVLLSYALLFAALLLITISFSADKSRLFLSTLGFGLDALLWGSVIIIYLSGSFLTPAVVERSLERLGAYSYSMYLLHLIVGSTVILALGNPPIFENRLIATPLIIIPATVLVSWLSYTAIEKPFLEMKTRYAKAAPDKSTPLASTPPASARPLEARAESEHAK